MDGLGDQLVTGAAFAEDDDRCIRLRGIGDQVEHLLHGRRRPDHAVRAVLAAQFAADALDLCILAYQIGDVGHGFHRASDDAVGVLDDRCVFHQRDNTAVLARQHTALLAQVANPEHDAPVAAVLLAGNMLFTFLTPKRCNGKPEVIPQCQFGFSPAAKIQITL